MELVRRLRQGVRAILWPFLEERGFTDFSDLAAWRRADRWIDCVQVTALGATRFGLPKVIGRQNGKEMIANAATFSVQIGCYYTDPHLLPWTGPAPERPRILRGESSRYPVCHRGRSLARSFEYGNVEGTLFPIKDDGSDMDAILEDALQSLESRGMSWLDSTHDIDAYLKRVNLDPSDYLDHEPIEIELTEEEETELKAWSQAKEIAERDSHMLAILGTGMPAFLQRISETVALRDHTGADTPCPRGDLYYGLLIGSGQRQEAIEALRRESDSELAKKQYEKILSASGDKRWANREHKFWESRLSVEREHLAILEAEQT